jgi:hypothetical protein
MHLIRKATQILLGATLIYTGTLHLTTCRMEFQAQVPTWLPFSPDFVVLASGVTPEWSLSSFGSTQISDRTDFLLNYLTKIVTMEAKLPHDI